MNKKRIFALLFAVWMMILCTACGRTMSLQEIVSQPETVSERTSPQADAKTEVKEEKKESGTIDKDGTYDSKEEVAMYIQLYKKLPSNYITKSKAQSLGWSGGSLEEYAPGKCIGGGKFGNYEGKLPKKSGRTYTECDIDTLGKDSRGAKRIVFSNDGLIYYTDDHYKTFTLLYGDENL